jgi:hypothetical protein
MNSWAGYWSQFLPKMTRLELSMVEKTLILTLLLSIIISGADTLQGRDIGNAQAIHMAKLQAQQEMMAQRLETGEVGH